jgi:phosphoglucosamine mutase
VAYLTRQSNAIAGVMITASHNPYEDNGIKFFNPNGFKLSKENEAELEAEVLKIKGRPVGQAQGKIGIGKTKDYLEPYLDFLVDHWQGKGDLAKLKIVVDCANGAAFKAAPRLFRRLGVEPLFLADKPDGKNINKACGSEHPDKLIQEVIAHGADIGVALDGDADRLVAVDETGTVLTGDQIIFSLALDLKYRGLLKPPTVVTTVMSNMGLRIALKENQIKHVEAGVGDRNVVVAMRETGAILGGEDSGHVVFLDRHTTGDGLFTLLRLLSVMANCNKKLSELRAEMNILPQVLINVPVKSKPDIKMVAGVSAQIASVKEALADEGRVLVRYSGTQPLCRVMVEGVSPGKIEAYAEKIGEAVKQELG